MRIVSARGFHYLRQIAGSRYRLRRRLLGVLSVPMDTLARIPDGPAPEEAAPLMCAGITTFNALRNSGARSGDLVAIQGIGRLGHLAS